MRAGPLDRPITIQRAVTTQNSFGEEVTVWQDVHETVWAGFDPGSGQESFVSEQRTARSTVSFTIRYRPGVTPRMRVLHDGQAFNIESVAEIGRRDGLLLTCEARELTAGPG